MSIKRLFHFWSNGRRFTRIERPFLFNIFRKKYFLNASFPFSFNLLNSCERLHFNVLRDTHPHDLFLEFSLLNSFFCSLCCELTVKCLLCSTKCLSFSQHFILLDAMFVSSRRMTSLLPFIPSISAPQSRMLGIHSMYSRIGIATLIPE